MNLNGVVVALDAGHGGSDPGARGKTSPEKHYNRLVTMVVRELLLLEGAWPYTLRWSAEVHGIDDKQFLRLADRVSIINNLRIRGRKVDISLCIHHNGGPPDAHGTEVWYCTGNVASGKLAVAVYAALDKRLPFVGRGVKHNKKFAMTKGPVMPAIITEACFVTNPKEEAWLVDNIAVEAMAIVAGLKAVVL